ncbi:MAG: agmatinase [Deltaproteobacteria bacterium]|nr:agmatinase [Deltaproteobacteria bacterium]
MPQTLVPGFLDLPPELSSWETARFAVLPIPYDATCSWGVGARLGPARLLEASAQVEWYDEEIGRTPCAAGIVTLRPVEPRISGPEATLAAVEEAARQVVASGKIPVGLGGEHSITWGLVRAVRGVHDPITVVQVDAHLDLRDTWQGSPWSHACVMRRILDDGVAVVQVGIRSSSEEEWDLVARRGLPVFRAREVVGRPGETWIPKVLESIRTEAVYLTVDLDGFDPSVVPGTGTPEPGGLGYGEGLALLRAVATSRRVVGFDVVELEPIPGSRVSEYAAARIVYKIMGYIG